MSINHEELALSWPTPNYVNPETRGDALVIVSAILVAAAGVAVVLRYISHWMFNRFGKDDICILIAWIMSVALVVADNMVTSRYGWNRHVWDVPTEWRFKVGMWSWIGKLLYTTALCFTRLSILAFYYQLIQGATWTKAYRRVLHTALVCVLVLYIVTMGLAIFMCTPVNAYWDVRYATHCRSEARELFATAVASCVCDGMLVILPIPIIWQLQMSRRKKIQAISLLSVGTIATASSCARTYYVWRMFHSTMDTSWNAYPIYFTTDLEIILGIICACAPHIKPLVKKWLDNKSSTQEQSFVKERVEDRKSIPSHDVESLDFITQASPGS